MPVLEYDFKVINANAVNQAFAAIERRAAQHNQRLNRVFGTPVSRAGGSSSAGSVPMAARARARAGLGEEEKVAKQTEAYWRRAHQKATDHRIRQDERAHAAKMRQIAREERAAQQAARAQEREVRNLARQQVRIEEQARRRVRRSAERAKTEGLGRARGTLGTVGDSVSRSLGAVGTIAGATLGLGGSFAMASAVQTQMSEAATASQLANQAGTPGLKGALLSQAQNVKGFTGAEALSGIEQFVTKTGDLETARAIIGDLGNLALATGSDLGDLGATAGQAFNVLKDQISDPVERVKELNKLMGVLAQQGSMGAVEIRDLAQDFGKLGAATRSFEGGAPELLRSMGAFAQIAVARGGAESSADASTAASRLAGDIVMHKDRFKGLGVDIKSKSDPTKLRNPMEIMADVLEKTGGDIEKTNGLFGIESGKIFKGLGATFSEAEKKQKGSGRAAVMAEFQRFSGANLSQGVINERAQSRLQDSDLQFKEAMKQFNSAIGRELLPTLTRLIPEFTQMIPALAEMTRLFARFVEDLAQNPIENIGKIIAVKVAADIAAAQIGGALKDQITGAVAGPFGKLGMVAGTLTGAFILAQAYIEGKFAQGQGKAEAAAKSADEVRAQAQAEIDTTGQLSPETREKLMKLRDTEQKTLKAADAAFNESWTDDVGRTFNQLTGASPENIDQKAALVGTASNARYQQGATETQRLLDVDELAKRYEGAADHFKKRVEEAGDALVQKAKSGPNRGDSPGSPVKS